MFIISPNDIQDNGLYRPSFTSHTPERVVLSRLSALAKRSHDYLIANLKSKSMTYTDSWSSVFQTSPNSLKSYSVLFRIDQSLCIDKGCSSTAGSFAITKDKDMICTPYNKSMEKLSAGPKDLRLKAYKNIQQTDSLVLNFQPIKYLMQQLKSQYGEYAVFFYNEYCPDIIAMLWRPSAFERQAFSAMHAEFTSPLDQNWEANALVTSNASDILRAIRGTMSEVLVDVKVLVDKSLDFESKLDEKVESTTSSKKKRKVAAEEEESDSSSDEDSD
jgi:U3 small nucleolar RNA-associated protein 22